MSEEVSQPVAPEVGAEEFVDSIETPTEQAGKPPHQQHIEETQAQVEDNQFNQDLKDAAEAGASKEELQDMIREYEIKVNGKTKNIKIDLDDEAELIRRLQLAEAGQEAMQENAETKKAFNDFMAKVKENPWALFSELGLDTDELLSQKIDEILKENELTPEQKKQIEMEQELENLRKEKEQAQREREERERQAQLDAATQQVIKEIDDAMEKTTLVKNDETRGLIADLLLEAENKGYKMTADMAARQAEKVMKNRISSLFEQMPADMVEQFLGRKTIDKLRQKRLQTKQKKGTTQQNREPSKPKVKQDNKKNIKITDYFESLREKYNQ